MDQTYFPVLPPVGFLDARLEPPEGRNEQSGYLHDGGGGGVPIADPSHGPDAGATCGRCFPATTMPLGVRSRICHTRS